MAERASHTYTSKDQLQFAAFSGDYNAMHVDEVAARQMPAGRPVVHGINLLLRGLEFALHVLPPRKHLSGINVRFRRMLRVEEPVDFAAVFSGSDQLRIQAACGTSIVLDASCRFDNAPIDATASANPPRLPRQTVPRVPAVRTLGSISDASGTFLTNRNTAQLYALFPNCAAQLGEEHIFAIAALSPLVGMVCPGQNSIFSGFELQFQQASTADALHYEVSSIDERFGLIRMAVNCGPAFGTVDTFLRPVTAAQRSYSDIRTLVSPDEFRRMRALVIGGSRGLGEVTSKIVAAGGGSVLLTYARGAKEASALQDEISDAKGSATARHYDVLALPAEQLDMATLSEITHIFYFATPRIFTQQREIFTNDRFDEFRRFYVDGFVELCRTAREFNSGIRVFYPSSTAVADRPADMTEYSMVKAAGEILCQEINKRWRPMRVMVRRLPRIRTDQTASVLPAEAFDPFDVMLPIVREMASDSAGEFSDE